MDTIKIFVFLFSSVLLFSCKPENKKAFKLVSKYDDKSGMYSYYDANGKKVLGDYYMVYTDTITEYGIVADPNFVLIDITGKHIYDIFPFDNGPDYTREGIYRITKNGKVGYADSITSKILIEPKFECAFPFENGKAKVSYKCQTVKEFPGDEHQTWKSNEWIFINRKGEVVDKNGL